MENRELKPCYEVRYSNKDGVYLSTCQEDILPEVIDLLIKQGKRIEQINIKWM